MTIHTATVSRLGSTLGPRLSRRGPGLVGAAVFVVGGLVYFFLWYPVFHHVGFWNTPGDIWLTYQVAGRVAHGHLGSVYVRYPDNFLTFPGIVFALAPVAALTSAAHLVADVAPSHVVAEPGAWALLAPYILLLSSIAVVACDAVAERLGVPTGRRLLLAAGEIVALWGVTVVWGHPEDAMATGLALYALLLGVDDRWRGAGWLFGVAVALQPLVIVTLPLLVVMAGMARVRALLLRAVVVPVLVLLGPVVANFHLTVKTLVQQPGYPNADHATPWTALAPTLFGRGNGLAVAAGPGRLVLILLACGVAWWSRRWRDRPEMLVWTFAALLALRPLTESVMLPYYLYPAVAVGLAAATRAVPWRFAAALAVAVFVTVSSQWHWSWAAWWVLNLAGTVVVVLLGLDPQAPPPPRPAAFGPLRRPSRSTTAARMQSTRGRGAAGRKQAKRQRSRRR